MSANGRSRGQIRNVKTTVVVEIGLRGLEQEQEEALSVQLAKAARTAVIDRLLAGETQSFEGEQAWEVHWRWSVQEARPQEPGKDRRATRRDQAGTCRQEETAHGHNG